MEIYKMPNTETKELSECTNWELMKLLVPGIEDYINEARINNNDLLKEISKREMSGFTPFSCFGGGFH